MSEFDAAIRFLWTYKATLSKKYWKQIESAIRVLEAAGKMTIEDATICSEGAMQWPPETWKKYTGPKVSEVGRKVNLLLSALPDPATDSVKDESIKDEKEKA